MCEPALPFGHAGALGVPEADIAEAKKMAVRSPILAYRFTTDKISPAERFVTLRTEFSGNIRACEIATGTKPFDIPHNAHSVLTGNYPHLEDPNHPVNHVFDEILGRLSTALRRF